MHDLENTIKYSEASFAFVSINPNMQVTTKPNQQQRRFKNSVTTPLNHAHG
jgi:hypothetical protein